MKECDDCEYRGYSPQFCRMHVKQCRKNIGREKKPLSRPVKVGAKTLAGIGMGMGAVIIGSAAVSLVGSAVLVHALVIKLSAGAGLAGGGIGLVKGLAEKNSEAE